jgi:hypothetical protein
VISGVLSRLVSKGWIIVKSEWRDAKKNDYKFKLYKLGIPLPPRGWHTTKEAFELERNLKCQDQNKSNANSTIVPSVGKAATIEELVKQKKVSY